MRFLLRATPDELPGKLAALGLSEPPEIDDAPDSDIGLSWSLPNTGIDLSFDDGRISSVFLYGTAESARGSYAGPLPLNLIWKTDFQSILSEHGPPSRHFHGFELDGPLGPTPPWIRYDTADHCVHIQFRSDKSEIVMVTVMTAERAP